MVSHLYRFRSLHRLLDQGELERQEIYFAKPEQLNDPMEGFRDIFWRGDEVVWENLFRHYILCLERAYTLLALSRPDEPFGWSNIPVFAYGDVSVTPAHKALLDKLVAAFLGDEVIRPYVCSLARRTVPVRRNELVAYLQYIHLYALAIIYRNNVEHGLQPKREEDPDLNERLRQALQRASLVIEQIARLETQAPNPELAIDTFFASHMQLTSQLTFIHQYNGTIDPLPSNKNLVFTTFCEEYVRKIETLVYPDWYPACFMRECRDSSVWGSYGDKHTAVRLKFKVRESQGKSVLRLRRITGFAGDDPTYGYLDHELHEIAYESEHLPIDFFRSLRLPIPTLRSQWYTDRAGHQSTCGDTIFKHENDWRDRYWKGFYHAITRKLKDWHHEQEYRLILSGQMLDWSDDLSRKAQYDFTDLDGLIFGINTPTDKKVQICKIIESKCRVVRREDFKFYQAFYSRATGKIEHAEMGLLKFKFLDHVPSSSDEVGRQSP